MEVGQVTWRYVVQTLPHQHSRLEDHSLTNWEPMKCREDRRDVMTTSAGDQTSCLILYRLEATEMDVGNAGNERVAVVHSERQLTKCLC